MNEPSTLFGIIKWFVILYVGVIVAGWAVRTFQPLADSLTVMGKLAVLAFIVAGFAASVVIKFLMGVAAIGGLWVTRNVDHVNRYGVDRDEYPMKTPK